MGRKGDTQGTSYHRPIPHPSPVTLGWQAQALAFQCCVWGCGERVLPAGVCLSGRLSLPALEAELLVPSTRPVTEGSGAHLSERRQLRVRLGDCEDWRRGSLGSFFPTSFSLLSIPFSPFNNCYPEILNPFPGSSRALGQRPSFKVAYVNFLISCLLRMAGAIGEQKEHKIWLPVPFLGITNSVSLPNFDFLIKASVK